MRFSRISGCVLSNVASEHVSGHHDPDALVEIGSFTKVLTGTVLMRLATEGIVELDDPVERWLNAPFGTGITLRNLADHSSGLPRLPPGVPHTKRDPYAAFTHESLYQAVARFDTLAVRPPGQKREYSNFGYAVLGAALVSAAATPFDDLVNKYVAEPLGVEDVTAGPPTGRRLAARSLLGRERPLWTTTGAILPAGGLWATTRAVAALTQALLLGRQFGEPAPSWQSTGRLWWHNGATKNAFVFAGALPDSGTWVVVHRLGGSLDDTEQTALRLLAQPRA
ncbi:serine hydrolase [Streptomyces niveiscabiei]|uniref:serine hydrolase domain-containing protein n=1 Tax=Streptomyces niveiscabiei TaxID=164115 RepID=UPI0029A98AD2|nr:serine hydrolase domain-containing protein [Streptomyces niveiscabiei]MDX3388192.1 serine hydrolase [Streptomyces niveiscabiei]